MSTNDTPYTAEQWERDAAQPDYLGRLKKLTNAHRRESWHLDFGSQIGGEPDEIIAGENYEGRIWATWPGSGNYLIRDFPLEHEDEAEWVTGKFNEYEQDLAASRIVILGLISKLEAALERERIVGDSYTRQQQSYRELEALYSAMTERATQAERENTELYEALDKHGVVIDQVDKDSDGNDLYRWVIDGRQSTELWRTPAKALDAALTWFSDEVQS